MLGKPCILSLFLNEFNKFYVFLSEDLRSAVKLSLPLYPIIVPFDTFEISCTMYLKILWKMEHLLQYSKCSISIIISKVFKTYM